MKYKLVNGGGLAAESWIKFAMPGKPLVKESVERPSESTGWAKLTVRRLVESHKTSVRKTASERFVEGILNEDASMAAESLKKVVEETLAKRFSEID